MNLIIFFVNRYYFYGNTVLINKISPEAPLTIYYYFDLYELKTTAACLKDHHLRTTRLIWQFFFCPGILLIFPTVRTWDGYGLVIYIYKVDSAIFLYNNQIRFYNLPGL